MGHDEGAPEAAGQDHRSAVLTIAIDAGGTFLKGNLLQDGVLLPDTSVQQPSQSGCEALEIINGLADLCIRMMERYMELYDPNHGTNHAHMELRLGIAFPGPFDYEAGICLIQGLGKYEQLYGLNIRELLSQQLKQRASALSSPRWLKELGQAPILFENDATLFALGVSRHYRDERLLCLTLGTGLGSAFVDHRTIVQGEAGVPASGMLYAEEFEGKLVDDQFGRRGILALADRLHARGGNEDVHDIANDAVHGDSLAMQVWQRYGERLGRMLKPYVASFKPDRLILGGQIAKSGKLFIRPLQDSLQSEQVLIQVEDQVLEHVFYGIDQLFD